MHSKYALKSIKDYLLESSMVKLTLGKMLRNIDLLKCKMTKNVIPAEVLKNREG